LPASHRHEERRRRSDFVRELLRGHGLELDADLAHRRYDLRVHARSRLGSRRDCAGFGGVAQIVEPRCRHLRAAGVVNASEQDGFHATSLDWEAGTTRRAGGAAWTAVAFGTSHRNSAVAAPAPISCATMKPGTSAGLMPEKVSVAARASVTAGFAKE